MKCINEIRNRVKEMRLFMLKTVKLLWKSSRISLIITLIINIFNGIINPLNLIISKYLIDSVIDTLSNKENYRCVIFWIIIEFASVILSKIIQRINAYYSIIQVKILNKYIADLIIKKSNELDLSFFENSEFYNKIEKVNKQSAFSAMAIMNSLMQIIKSFTTLIGSIVIVIQLSPIMFILCFVTSIPMFLINIKISDYKYNVFNEIIEKTRFAEHLQNLILNYNNIKEIKLYRLGKWFYNLILSIYEENLNKEKSVEKKRLFNLSLVDCFGEIISYLYKFYIIITTITNGLTIGSMNMYINSITNVDSSIKTVLDNISELYSSNLYIEDLFYVLELKPVIIEKENPKEFNKNTKNCIEFRNVSFKYPGTDKFVLKNVSFKINENQNCALVGLNGCGKTTITKLLVRLYEPTEGEILIGGININEFSLESIYKYINVVFQDFMKYPFTVRENIGFGNIEKIDDINAIEESAKKANAYDFIQELTDKFNTKLGKLWSDGKELSLGQWQKLAISRAFMGDTSILVLDEPTASVDAETEYEIFKSFKDLVGNKTSLLISHRFSTVRDSDKIILLNDGKVEEIGTHEELMNNNGLYFKLFNMQAEGYGERKQLV